MIQDENRFSPEDEAKLGSYLLRVHDYVEKLQSLHKFFKFTSSQLMEIFNSDPDAYQNLDILLYLFFGDNEMIFDELLHDIEEARKLMQSRNQS